MQNGDSLSLCTFLEGIWLDHHLYKANKNLKQKYPVTNFAFEMRFLVSALKPDRSLSYISNLKNNSYEACFSRSAIDPNLQCSQAATWVNRVSSLTGIFQGLSLSSLGINKIRRLMYNWNFIRIFVDTKCNGWKNFASSKFTEYTLFISLCTRLYKVLYKKPWVQILVSKCSRFVIARAELVIVIRSSEGICPGLPSDLSTSVWGDTWAEPRRWCPRMGRTWNANHPLYPEPTLHSSHCQPRRFQ